MSKLWAQHRKRLRFCSFAGCVLAATTSDAAQVALAWADNSSNEAGFKIERATATGAFGQIATVGANVTGYVDAAVSVGANYNYRVRAYNAVGDSGYSNTAQWLVSSGSNQAPTISNIVNRSIAANATTGVVAFTIGDADSAAASLTLSGSSSNTTLVPNSSIVFGGSGASRTVTVTPAANRSGTATVSVTVSDGVMTSTDTFVLTVAAVNAAPTISNIPDQATRRDTPTGAIAFTIGDAETAAASLTLTASSSDRTLVPNSSVVFGGSGANRTITVTPAANRNGNATITVTVSDGTATAKDTFSLTVGASAGNNPPAVGGIADQSGIVGGRIGPISFSVVDSESSAASLIVTATSSNQTLVPGANILLGGGGATRTITVVGAPARSGLATITVTVSDGVNVSTETFVAAFNATLPATSRLINLSTRVVSLAGSDPLIPGFVISGVGSKRMLIRVVGPTLGAAPYNVPGVLPNPRMTLKRWNGTAFVDFAANDDWGTNANLAAIRQASADLFAFALPAGSRDAVLLTDLLPGRYTIIADDASGANGLVIVELYDGDISAGNANLVNLSNRGFVGTGSEVMITGFVVSQEAPKTLLIRAVGPGLAVAPFNVSNTLVDPVMEIYRRDPDTGDTLVLSQDNWGDAVEAAKTALIAAQVSAFALPTGSKDAAVVATLPPGIYTVIVRGANSGIGTGLIEVYNVE